MPRLINQFDSTVSPLDSGSGEVREVGLSMKARKAVNRETTRRYGRANRRTKTLSLDEESRLVASPAPCDQGVQATPKPLWALFGLICARRLAPAIRANLAVLDKFRELKGLGEHTRRSLLCRSPAGIDRLLYQEGKDMRLKGRSHTRAGPSRRVGFLRSSSQ